MFLDRAGRQAAAGRGRARRQARTAIGIEQAGTAAGLAAGAVAVRCAPIVAALRGRAGARARRGGWCRCRRWSPRAACRCVRAGRPAGRRGRGRRGRAARCGAGRRGAFAGSALPSHPVAGVLGVPPGGIGTSRVATCWRLRAQFGAGDRRLRQAARAARPATASASRAARLRPDAGCTCGTAISRCGNGRSIAARRDRRGISTSCTSRVGTCRSGARMTGAAASARARSAAAARTSCRAPAFR